MNYLGISRLGISSDNAIYYSGECFFCLAFPPSIFIIIFARTRKNIMTIMPHDG